MAARIFWHPGDFRFAIFSASRDLRQHLHPSTLSHDPSLGFAADAL